MLIDDLIDFCDSRRKNMLAVGGSKCTRCDMPAHWCNKNCGTCLNQIHFTRKPGERTDYDCENMIDFYVCSYTHKYASEFLYMLTHFNAVKNLEEYRIISIGCGGCSDLIAFDKFAQDIRKNFYYVGIERNPSWHYVHGFLCSKINTEHSSSTLRFIYGDAINIISRNIDNITANNFNILVMNYVLSSVYYSGYDKAVAFCNDIMNILLKNPQLPKPFIVLINDINTPDVTQLIDNFSQQIIKFYGSSANIARDSFPYDKTNKCGPYQLLFSLPAFLDTDHYRIRQYCTSSVMAAEIG
ncbi:MAG: hypothetical protein IJU26_03295 [Synergistaceae bacterium]|nr:hypothetical protein [Synergistaceae bacterium]